MKKIVLTGGGTAGHVTPNIALMDALKADGFQVYYIGSRKGIEKTLIAKTNVPYYAIQTGKLRRYLSFENVTDIGRIVLGLGEALKILGRLKPDIVFSKGGFVAVPVVLAAQMKRIPVILHESDLTPGLANKISMPAAQKICVTFPETLRFTKGKGILTGSPVRKELFEGEANKAQSFLGFGDKRPILLVMGGSLGSAAINRAVRNILPALLKTFNVVHLCGKGHCDETLKNKNGYKQFEYVNEELFHIFKAASLVVSRSGASSLCEFLALKLPALLVPLPTSKSRGDQLLNAKSFEKQGFSKVLYEEEITDKRLLSDIHWLYENRDGFIQNMQAVDAARGTENVMAVIREQAIQK